MTNVRQVSSRHHYVPEFLIKPWANHGVVAGYWWDSIAGLLRCNQKGPKAFCYETDLFSLQSEHHSKDQLERLFFEKVDTLGADARDQLLKGGVDSLSHDQRCNFARLLLSLDSRRPQFVAKVRTEGRQQLVHALDNDDQIMTAMVREGIDGTPSSYFEEQTKSLLEDRAVTGLQQITDNPKIGSTLLRAHWILVELTGTTQALVLSDRPMIRTLAYDHPMTVWALPLSPTTIFCAANARNAIERIRRINHRRLAIACNQAGASQADRYIFSVSDTDRSWLEKYLIKAVHRTRSVLPIQGPAA